MCNMELKTTRTITEIIVHCSATPEGRDVGVEAIRDYHVKQRGWSDIGYHFIITLDGRVKAGRPLDKAGAHTRGHNAQSIGICYIGGLDSDGRPKDTRTPSQRAAMLDLLCRLKRIYPTASIHGHNEFAAKACPCFDARNEYRSL